MPAKTAKPAQHAITVRYVLYAEPAKVFEALTREGIIGEWCDGGGKVEEKVGGSVELFGGWVTGEVTKFDKRRKVLSYTWKPSEWNKKTPASLVEFILNNHSAGTEVTVEHSGFPSAEEAGKHESGWIDFFFEPLNDYFTT